MIKAYLSMTEETDSHIDQVEAEETPKRVLKITKSPARGTRPLHPHEPKMAVRINERDDEQSLFPKDKYIVTVDLPDPNQPPYIHIYSCEERWSISVYIDSPKLYKVYLYGEREEGDTFEDVITRVCEWLPKPTQMPAQIFPPVHPSDAPNREGTNYDIALYEISNW